MFTNLMLYLAYSKKAVIQVAGLIVTVGTFILTFQSAIPDYYVGIITAAVAAAVSILHWASANADAPGDAPASEPFDIDAPDPEDAEDPQEDWKPAELVTATQVGSSVPPDLATPATADSPAQ